MKSLEKLTTGTIDLYQQSRKLFRRNPTCRFVPTCSEYTKEAVRRHGMIKGLWLGVKRIGRCHPWSEGGYDPVPDRAEQPNNLITS